jgi:hypothetical protein
MNETEDILDVVKIRNAKPIWDNEDQRIIGWELDVEGESYPADMSPKQIRLPLEAVVRLKTVEGWRPIVATSRLYKPIPHQKVTRIFEESTKWNVKPHAFVDEPTRIVMLYDEGQPFRIVGDELSFNLSVTNSYDLSLGINIDGYLENKTYGWGFFLGLAGKWEATFKHYWDEVKLRQKMTEKIAEIMEKKNERIELCASFASVVVTPDIITKVARALNCQKKEKHIWDVMVGSSLPEGVSIEATWVKNAGFTCVTTSHQITAWQMLGLFAAWGSGLTGYRKTDVAQRLFMVVESILKEENAI